MKKIYLAVDDKTFFSKQLKFVDLDYIIFINYFKNNNLDIEVITLKEIIQSYTNIKNSIIFTISSQKPYHKSIIDDYYEYIALNNRLIPSRESIKAHDNKGYQELYKESKGIFSLKFMYINRDIINYDNVKIIGYPLVLKQLGGSGSKGVQLIKDEASLQNEINKLKPSLHIRYFIYLKELFLNKILRKNNMKKIEYFKDYDNYVLQEFVPNLKNDYKVLIFFDKYYVLKRNIKKHDFRASGSGNFEFVDIDDSLLDYAKKMIKSFNEPFLSLDICYDGEKYYLIEYQGIHFGSYTQINAIGYYQRQDNKWKYIKEKVSLEEDIAYSLYNYIIKNNLLNDNI